MQIYLNIFLILFTHLFSPSEHETYVSITEIMAKENEALEIRLNLYVQDNESNSITSYLIVNNTLNGNIINLDSNTGLLTYKPNAGFNGVDNFTFKAKDSEDFGTQGKVTIIVVPENNPPFIHQELTSHVIGTVTMDENDSPKTIVIRFFLFFRWFFLVFSWLLLI